MIVVPASLITRSSLGNSQYRREQNNDYCSKTSTHYRSSISTNYVENLHGVTRPKATLHWHSSKLLISRIIKSNRDTIMTMRAFGIAAFFVFLAEMGGK